MTARTIPAEELTRGLEEWEQDYAVLFHANWCTYCRQFKPIWHEIARQTAESETKEMDVVMFDCEARSERASWRANKETSRRMAACPLPPEPLLAP